MEASVPVKLRFILVQVVACADVGTFACAREMVCPSAQTELFMFKRKTQCQFSAQVGARIRALRTEVGWTQRKLAKMANCCSASLVEIEKGRTAIRIVTLQKIAKALNVQLFDLLNHDADQNDAGFILEMIRRKPQYIAMTKAKVEALCMVANAM